MSAATCYLCGSAKCEKLSEQLRAGLETRYALRPHRCSECGFVFLHPLMSPEAEADFYRHEYRQIYHGGYYDLAKFDHARQADSDQRCARLAASGLLRGDVLDAGCSTGNFLTTIREKVTSVRGVEPDERQRIFAQERGLSVEDDIARLGGERFHLITVFHVLEHIRDPIGFLAKLGELLTPGGVIAVEVPNVDDALLARFHIEEFATFYWHPAHSYYFSAKTLETVAARAGFRAEMTGVQRYTLANHLAWLRDRKPGGRTVSADFISAETERAYAADLCRSFACDTLWMIARPGT